MSFWKRNAVIAAVVLFVGTAVYLNWNYGQAQETGTDAEQTGEKVLGQPVLVDGTTDNTVLESAAPQATDETDQTDGTNQAETGDNAGDSQQTGDYFDAARLTRQQARDSALSMMQESEGGDTAVMAESIQTLADATMAESRIENLITAKGYTDCVAFIGENSVSVVVSAGENGLSNTDVAKITDIIKGETNFAQNQIKIIPAQTDGTGASAETN